MGESLAVVVVSSICDADSDIGDGSGGAKEEGTDGTGEEGGEGDGGGEDWGDGTGEVDEGKRRSR